MNVHHTKAKQAMAMGCHLSEGTDHKYRIFWPRRSVELFGNSIDEVLNEMRAVQQIVHEFPDYKVSNPRKGIKVAIIDTVTGRTITGPNRQPSEMLAILEAGEDNWTNVFDILPETTKPIEDRINGIPRSGAVAFKEGVPAGDCPYLEDSDDFARWNDEWDEAADKAEDPQPTKGSVVTNRYRAQYSEYGHPTHCGDELAILLNNICLNKAGCNLELFEAICVANGVDLRRYDRKEKGWQGRLRMTGRNLLAKKLKANQGVLLLPNGTHYNLSRDWLLQAETKFKPKVTT